MHNRFIGWQEVQTTTNEGTKIMFTVSTNTRRTIQVELLQNVMNPRGHLNGFSFTQEPYHVKLEGDYVEFEYDSSNITMKEQRILDNIKAGKAFPIALGTKRECFATKFKVVYDGVTMDYCED